MALETSYTRIRELGRGGMGVVTLARQHSLDRLVAIKELILGEGDEDALIARFSREASALARLSHPNVVRLLDFDLAHQPPYLVCEYVPDAVPLSSLMLEEPPGFEDAIIIALQLAEGLAHIHAAGLLHRDLKPGNVLVDGAGNVRIIDFGLARSVTAEQVKLTQTGHLIGTFTYMPPEQMAGKVVDASADVYAFGLIVYELLVRELVFASGSRQPVAPGERWKGRIPPLEKRLPDLSPALLSVVNRCLALAPAERYTNGGAVLAALAPVLRPPGSSSGVVSNAALRLAAVTPAHRPARTAPITPPPPVKDDRSGLHAGVLVAVAGLLGVVAGLVFWPSRRTPPPPPPPRASVEAPAPRATPALLAMAQEAALIEPRSVLAASGKRPPTSAELSTQRAEVLRRYAPLIEQAAAVLDAPDVSFDAKRTVYLGISRVRLLDRMLLLHGLARLEVSTASGRTFGAGARPGLNLGRQGLGLASDVLKFRQIGVELPGLLKDIIEDATLGAERVNVDLSTPARELKWAAVFVRTHSLTRRDIVWVVLNDLSLMLDERSVATRDDLGWVICHFVDPRLLRTTGNTIAVAHEALPGEGSASLMRRSSEVGIAGGVQPLP